MLHLSGNYVYDECADKTNDRRQIFEVCCDVRERAVSIVKRTQRPGEE